MKPNPIADEWIETWGELARYTGLSDHVLRCVAARGGFRVVRLAGSGRGVRVRFMRAEIDRWLKTVAEEGQSMPS